MLFAVPFLFPQLGSWHNQGEAEINLCKVAFQLSSEKVESEKRKLYFWLDVSSLGLEKCLQDCALIRKFLGHSLVSSHQKAQYLG